jgi:hypothetical protein
VNERRALQIVVAAGSLVPICAGAAGALIGPSLLGQGISGPPDLDSHFRYLSGLLLGIGVAFASTIPAIERQTARFRLLTFIVVAGGVGRLLSLRAAGAPSNVMIAAFIMELAVTPSLALWQHRVATQPGTR